MDQGTQEIRRVYRLDFNSGETAWDDPIAPDVASGVLGRKTTSSINRTSLLVWALMNIPQVQVADLAFEGWIMISISPDADFDEPAFKSELAATVQFIREVRSERGQRGSGMQEIVEGVLSLGSGFAEMRAPA